MCTRPAGGTAATWKFEVVFEFSLRTNGLDPKKGVVVRARVPACVVLRVLCMRVGTGVWKWNAHIMVCAGSAHNLHSLYI